MLDDSLDPNYDLDVIESGPKPRAPSRPWTAQEDTLLRAAVAKYGDDTDQWIAIAAAVPGRTNKSCRKRWKHSLSPTLKKTAWTKEEDELLVKLHAEYPCRWSMIAKQISGRTDDACAKRYREALDPSIKQGEWSEEEDQRLLIEYRRWGGRWASVAAQLGRSGLGCRNRWRLLERKKAHSSRRSRSSSSSNGDEQDDSAPGRLSDVVPKTEVAEANDHDPAGPSNSQQHSQWNDLFDQFQNEPYIQDNSFASGSGTRGDMNIPIDPHLASIFDSNGQPPSQFDFRIWDIMNGGCGCGCGSSNVGCGCADDAMPPFLDIPSMDFLGPFQQLSQSFPPPEQLGQPSLSDTLSIPAPQQLGNIPHVSHPPLQPSAYPTFDNFAPPSQPLPHGNEEFFAAQPMPSNNVVTVPPMAPEVAAIPQPQSLPVKMDVSPSAPIKQLMSPRTLAMYHDLPPQFANIDPVKFAAALALAKAKDTQQKVSCNCTGACCGSRPHVNTTAAADGLASPELEKAPVKKSCCAPRTDTATISAAPPAPTVANAGTSTIARKRSRSPSASDNRSPIPEAGPSKKRSKTNAQSASTSTSSTKAQLMPRLSSHLEAVPRDSNLLPYACGDVACWRADDDIRARFNTSGELLDHWRREHESDDQTGRVMDGKVFRCALEGCGKGWKSINGIQYHLQISKAHFSNAINKTVLSSAGEKAGSCCGGGSGVGGEDGGEAGADDGSASTSGGSRKRHPCTHPGCPKVYKQAAGLKYHLAHGHPQSGPVQLDNLPPVLFERMAQGTRLAATV